MMIKLMRHCKKKFAETDRQNLKLLSHSFTLDVIILCKTKKQLARCRRRLMNILQERKLKLSRKKTRMGPISMGFHFCGVEYPGTQTQNITGVEPAINDDHTLLMTDDDLVSARGGVQLESIIALSLFVSNRRVERISANLRRDSNPHTTWRADFPHHAVQDLLHSTANDFILTSGILNLGCCIGNRSMIFMKSSHLI